VTLPCLATQLEYDQSDDVPVPIANDTRVSLSSMIGGIMWCTLPNVAVALALVGTTRTSRIGGDDAPSSLPVSPTGINPATMSISRRAADDFKMYP